ncbi:hypothetical protein AAHC03_016534 [Spirometra sp. Aus1]
MMSGPAYTPLPQTEYVHDSTLTGDIHPNKDAPASQPQRVSIFHLDFYKSYFDVDTNQVLKRLCSSVWPFSKECSLYSSLQPTPDLYGPFWITVTLIFSVAFAGSIREYLLLRDKSALSTFNFMRVTITSALLLTYWCIVPLLIACAAWFRRQKQDPGTEQLVGEDSTGLKMGQLFTDLLAVYGYSLTAFVPCTLLLVIPSFAAQMAILVLATALSCSVLATATLKTFQHHKKQNAIVFVVIVIVLHLAMAVCLSLVFFHQPSEVASDATPLTAAAAPPHNGTASQPIGTNPKLSESKSADIPRADGIQQKGANPPAP